MLKALILFLEAPIQVLVPLVDYVHSCDKLIEALILDFKALFEYPEEGIQRNRFVRRLFSTHLSQGFCPLEDPWHHRALLRRRSSLV